MKKINVQDIKNFIKKDEIQSLINNNKDNFLNDIQEIKIFFKNIFQLLENKKNILNKLIDDNNDLNISYDELDNILYKDISDKNTDINSFIYDYCNFDNEKDNSKLLSLLYFILYFPFLDNYKYGDIIYFIFKEEILLTYSYVYFYTGNTVVENLYNIMMNDNNIIPIYTELEYFSFIEDFKIKGSNIIKEIPKFHFGSEESLDFSRGVELDIKKELRGKYDGFLNEILTKALKTVNINDNNNFNQEIQKYIIKEYETINMNNTFGSMFGKEQENPSDYEIIEKVYSNFKSYILPKIIIKLLFIDKKENIITKNILDLI